MKSMRLHSLGFSIIELLAVVIVVSILAVVTTSVYNGTKNRSRTTTAEAAASMVERKAETVYLASAPVRYPIAAADFEAQPDTSLSGSGIILAPIAAATQPSNPNTVEYLPCTNPSGAGASISYWDYAASPPAKRTNNIGDACTTYSATALTASY